MPNLARFGTKISCITISCTSMLSPFTPHSTSTLSHFTAPLLFPRRRTSTTAIAAERAQHHKTRTKTVREHKQFYPYTTFWRHSLYTYVGLCRLQLVSAIRVEHEWTDFYTQHEHNGKDMNGLPRGPGGQGHKRKKFGGDINLDPFSRVLE